MTVSSTTNRTDPQEGNGVSTSFPFSFKVDDSSHLRVIHTDTDSVESVLVENTDYSVSLNADQKNNAGGSITYPLSGSPLPSGEYLTPIRDQVPQSQSTALPNQGAWQPEVVEQSLDKLTQLVQQLSERIDRAVLLNVNSALSDLLLPDGSANDHIGWDSDGTGLENKTPESGIALPLSLANGGLGTSHANIAAVVATLGLVIGTNVQAYDENTSKTDETETMSAAKRPSVGTISWSTNTYTPALDTNQDFTGTLESGTANTIANPSDIDADCIGQTGTFTITQHASSASTLAWGSYYKTTANEAFSDAVATTTGSVTTYDYKVISATHIELIKQGTAT